jgi:hypothetical protein
MRVFIWKMASVSHVDRNVELAKPLMTVRFVRKNKEQRRVLAIKCDPGTYLNEENMMCLLCHPSCGSCKGPSEKDCLSCTHGLPSNGSC